MSRLLTFGMVLALTVVGPLWGQESTSIQGRIILDLHNDPTEPDPGLEHVDVELSTYDGLVWEVIATTTSDSTGQYLFDLPVGGGTYRVRVETTTLPPSMVQTIDPDTFNVVFDHMTEFFLGTIESATDVDFGYQGPNSLQGTIFEDLDGDGTLDAGETDLNAELSLYDSDGDLVFRIPGNKGGSYLIDKLPADDYLLQINPNSVGGRALSADPDGVLDHQTLIPSTAPQSVTGLDFGYNFSAAVGDRVWTELQGDGVFGEGDDPLSGVTVDLLDGIGNVVDSATTDANGYYYFSNLSAGAYEVQIDATTLPADAVPQVDPDGVLDYRHAFSLTSTTIHTGVDFAFGGLGSIFGATQIEIDGDFDTFDGPHPAGVAIELWDSQGNLVDSTVSDAQGSYHFLDLALGNYRLVVDPSTLPTGLTPMHDPDGIETANEAWVTVGMVEPAYGYFTWWAPGQIAVYIWYDDEGIGPESIDGNIPNVRVELRDDVGTVLDSKVLANGADWAAFQDLAIGDYQITVDGSTIPEGYEIFWNTGGPSTSDSVALTVEPGSTVEASFGYTPPPPPAEVSVYAYFDADGDPATPGDSGPFEGIRMELRDSSGTVVDSWVQTASGNHYFTDLEAGDYTVTVDPSTIPYGYVPFTDTDGTETTNSVSLSLTPGETGYVDFGYAGPVEISVYAYFDADGDPGTTGDSGPFEGIRLELRDSSGTVVDSWVQDGSGNHYFTGLLFGDYTVTVDPSTIPYGYVPFTDTDGSETENSVALFVTPGQTGYADFGFAGPAEISVYAFFDADGDPGTTGDSGPFEGIRMELRDSSGTVVDSWVQDGSGNHYFTGLLFGDYTVTVDPSTVPYGYVPYTDSDGSETENTVALFVTPGQTGYADFGFAGPAEISVYAFFDADGDSGTTGDSGHFDGIRMELRDASGTVVDSWVQNGPSNHYFTGLLFGEYTVTVDPSTVPYGYVPFTDSDGSETENTVTLFVTPGQTGYAEFGFAGPAEISVYAFSDADGDPATFGDRNAFDGIRMELRDASGTVVDSWVQTGLSNHYFTGLLFGEYTVTVDASTVPLGYVPFTDSDGSETENTVTLFVTPGDTGYAEFGFAPFGPTTAGLLAHWSFDDGAGTVASDTTGNFDGTLIGDPSWASGYVNTALDFDGVGDMVEVPTAPALETPAQLTLAAWVKSPSAGAWQSIIDKRDGGYDGYDLFLSDQGRAFMRINSETIVGSAVLTDDTWYHVAATYDGSEFVLYVDGVVETSKVVGAINIDTVAPLRIGGHFGGTSFFLTGSIDEPRVYDRALDAAEIADLAAFTGGADRLPPVVSNGAPSGAVAAGSVTLSVDTHEEATCRFSTTAGQSYDAMTSTFSTVDGLGHSATVTVDLDTSYTYFVRCSDLSGNANAEDYAVTFFVPGASDIFSNLQGHWTFDEGTGGTVGDASANGYTGTIGGNPAWIAGQNGGNALDFDGSGDSVSFGATPVLSTPSTFTVSAWVNHEAPANAWQSLVDKRDTAYDGYDLYLDKNSRAFMRVNLETVTGSTVITPGQWHHVVGIYDGSQLLLYVDGVLDATANVGTLTIDAQASLLFGENFAGGNSFLHGALDDVRIYDRALSADDVAALHAATP